VAIATAAIGIEKKIKELENLVSKKWPNKVDHDNMKNTEYLEGEIKLLEDWGWPKKWLDLMHRH
jgi:hypothetical protein